MRKHQFVHLLAEYMDAIGEDADPYAEVYGDVVTNSPRKLFQDSWEFLALAFVRAQEAPESQRPTDTMLAIVAHVMGLAYLYARDEANEEEEAEADEEEVSEIGGVFFTDDPSEMP